MPRYDAYPQYPDEVVTPFNPKKVTNIRKGETVIIGARSKDVAMRDTCREFMGYDVPQAKPKPPGNVEYCTSCHEWKHCRDFGSDDRKVNGLQSHCKSCERERQKRIRIQRSQTYRKTA